VFERSETPWGFTPTSYECRVCSGKMLAHVATCHKPPVAQGWVNTMMFKCMSCFATQGHAIPIDEEYVEELRQRRGGQTTYIPWSREHGQGWKDMNVAYTKKERGEIKARLEALGYF